MKRLEIAKDRLEALEREDLLEDLVGRPPIRLASYSDKQRQIYGEKPKITVIEERMRASGRKKRWYGEKCGYAFCLIPSTIRRRGEGSKSHGSSFYAVAKGQKIPKQAAKRKKLANLLGGVPSDFWHLNDEGYLVARIFGERDERKAPSVKHLPDISIEEM